MSPLLSVHRWVIAAALHPAKRGVSQLRGHYLDSYWTSYLHMWVQRADMSTARKIRHSTEPCHDMPPQRRCCKPQEITDGQIQDIEHAMRQVGIRGGRPNENEMFCFEAEHYLGFQTPWVFWETERGCFCLMLCLKLQKWNLKNPMKTKHKQIKSLNLGHVNQRIILVSKVEVYYKTAYMLVCVIVCGVVVLISGGICSSAFCLFPCFLSLFTVNCQCGRKK